MIRKLTKDEVEFEIQLLQEDTDYRGNCMASGDPSIDRQAEKDIREQLLNGNEWAWCVIKVTAIWKSFGGFDILGGCSYFGSETQSPEEQFRADPYFEDMKNTALGVLNDNIENVYNDLKELITVKDYFGNTLGV